MNAENYLPSIYWTKDPKDSLKRIIAKIGLKEFLIIIGYMVFPPLGLLVGPVLWYTVIKYILKEQKDKKIQAVLDVYPNRYTKRDLELLYEDNKQEFTRLFKLSSDEFFRKYVNEQADHKKAQEIIRELQKRIYSMQERIRTLSEGEQKHKDDIEKLKNEISVYEDIFNNWRKKA